MELNKELVHSIESLQTLIANGIIERSEGEQKIYMTKEKAVLKVHTRAINQRSDGRYLTKVKLNDDLKQISGKTYEELISKLFDIYYGYQNMSLQQFFLEWIEYRKTESSVTAKTIKENQYLWNAYMKDVSISKIPIRLLKPKDFIVFFRSITKGRTMTKKRFNDFKSVLNGIFTYAIEKDIISHNPLLEINYNQFSYKAVDNIIVPYTEDERKKILDYLPENDLYSLAIKLFFHLTIRIGELKGFRFDDVYLDFIHVCRSVNDKHEIENHIKGNTSAGFRDLPLTAESIRIIDLIKELNPNSEYMFSTGENTFITTVTFNRRLKKCCDSLGILYRPSHKLRFSTASILHEKGVSDTELQGMLGHTSLNMTRHYLRNVAPQKKTFNKVREILA